MEERFQTMRRVGDGRLETRARALADISRPYVKEFTGFEMPPDFVKTLEAKIDTFTVAVKNHKASRAAHVTTTQEIDAAMERAVTTIEQLDAVMENKLDGNPSLQANWENVRKIERRWVSKKPAEAAAEETPKPLAPAA